MTYKGFTLEQRADGWHIVDSEYYYSVAPDMEAAKAYVDDLLWVRENVPY